MSSSSTTFTSGQSPTATQVNGWAQGTLGYSPVTANQGSITALVDLTGLAATVTLVAGRRIRVSGMATFSSTVSGDGALIAIYEGGTQLAIATYNLTTTGIHNYGTPVSVILTPTAGSHTYKLATQRNGGSGTLTMEASATVPAYILVEDIGAV